MVTKPEPETLNPDEHRKVFKAKEDIGLKDDNIVGKEEHTVKVKEFEEANVVMDEWNSSQTLYDELYNRINDYRDFYLGADQQQWKNQPEGDLKLVFNLGAAIIDLFSYILGNNPPTVQFKAEGSEKLQLLRADIGEDLTKKAFDNAKFSLRFRDGVKNQFLLGFSWLLWIWNPQNKDGGPKGTLELANLNPFTTRVKLSSTDAEKVDAVIATERISIVECFNRYHYEALPDQLDPFLPKGILSQDDGMVTVFRRYGPNSVRTVVNGRQVAKITHNYGFCPAVQINNIKVPNDAFGYGEITRWQSIAQELNELLTAASEIARDLGYPPILEYNNALGGRKIQKWRGQKIPVKNLGSGEAVQYMINTAQIEGLLKQAQFLLEIFHFVSLMPKAAAGVFEASVTSGFQAQLAMQPATLTTENRKVDWEIAVRDLVKMAIKIIEKEAPETLSVKTEKGDTVKFEGLALHDMQVVWPENLPVDIAREIQNLVLGIQNNITSVRQAIDKYNVLMGMGSSSDTEEFLSKEADQPEINPDRALKVAQAESQIKQLSGVMDQANGEITKLRGEMNGGENPAETIPGPEGQGQGQTEGALPAGMQEAARQENPTNLLRSATSPLPEERRTTSATSSGVSLNSTGGVIPKTRRNK